MLADKAVSLLTQMLVVQRVTLRWDGVMIAQHKKNTWVVQWLFELIFLTAISLCPAHQRKFRLFKLNSTQAAAHMLWPEHCFAHPRQTEAEGVRFKFKRLVTHRKEEIVLPFTLELVRPWELPHDTNRTCNQASWEGAVVHHYIIDTTHQQ